MTLTDLTNFQALCIKDYKNFCLSLINKSKYTLKDVTKEYDWDLWLQIVLILLILIFKKYGKNITKRI